MGAGAVAAQEQAQGETTARLRWQAEEAAARLGVPITLVVEVGDPYHQLLRVAEEIRADAVVVGESAKPGTGEVAGGTAGQGWPLAGHRCAVRPMTGAPS